MNLNRWVPIVLGLAALVIAHYVALIFRVSPAISLWFPPSGVAVALSLWFGWIGVILTWIASFSMSHLWGNDGWYRLASLTDITEPLVALLLFRYFWRSKLDFKRLTDAVTFIISAPILGCGASASVGCLVLSTVGKMPWLSLSENILRWWLGNAVGVMAITPLLLLLFTPFLTMGGYIGFRSQQSSQPSVQLTAPTDNSTSSKQAALQIIITNWLEAIIILILCIFTAITTVQKADTSSMLSQNYSFLNFIPIIWAATRFQIIGGTLTASFCVFATVVAYIINFPNADTSLVPFNLEIVQVHKLSLFVQCGVSLLIGSAITEQATMQTMLAVERVRAAEYQVKAQLSQQLEQANIQLQKSNQEKDELLEREQIARNEAESANRIKDEFLAVLSHELRTPLNPILGWTKILRSRKLDEAKNERALETIERNTKLLNQLIDDLLDVSRILRGKFTLNAVVVNLESIIQAAIDTVQLAANAKSINLQFVQTTRCLVMGDINRLQQVLCNLLTNAIKFTPNGGNVSITLSQITLGATTSNYAQITVTDTGKGINPEFLPYVFERFRQADSSITRTYGGLGLGLAIVRQIVELHGGTVAAASVGENKGATFTVQLPIHQN
ncbi:ATPase, histidine kinase-, DNA gyrase B-, and HSP90-like domain protein [Calothrix sp. NIES-4071]|nr:ATPase, histidine kinase-, DNA gyrase B-, and HSP90-like domain protein [Calothrix sp. NIES-4071]BAZ58525.1 ATPase, histidine kinase-, DNA gyrase B-, and HSP90-like domain protein [Calothrix sp. NIES-4105]